MAVVYLQCDSEDEDSEDNRSIWPVPENLHLIETNEQMYLGDSAWSDNVKSHSFRKRIKSNLALILQRWVTEQVSNTKEEEQAVKDSQ